MSLSQIRRIAMPRDRRIAPKLLRFGYELLPLMTILTILLFWEAAVVFNWINPLFLAAPTEILSRGWELFRSGEIYPNLVVSLQEACFGFFFALIVGILLGLLMGRLEIARRVLEPIAMALYSTPSVALLPLFILWFGIGLWSKVIVVFLSTVFSILVNTQAGVKSCNPKLIETAQAFCASETVIFFEIVLPAAVPFIVAGIRIAIGRMLIAVFAAELYASSKGIGFMIVQAGSQYDTPTLFVGVLLLTCTGVILSQALGLVESRVFARYREQ